MELGVVLLTLGMYGLAIFVWWRVGTPNYLVALLAGQLGTLPSPIWQRLYRFSYNPRFVPQFELLDQPLPQAVLLGGWIMILPALVVYLLYQYRWWFPGYRTGLVTYVVFMVYHLLIETIGARVGWWQYQDGAVLPLNFSMTLLAGLMNGLISFGFLSVLLLTRRYAWLSLLLILLPAPLLLSLLVNGLLGAPLYTVLLLRTQEWAGTIGILGTLGLIAWATHIIASAIEGQRVQRQYA